jgi:hypothetical protein
MGQPASYTSYGQTRFFAPKLDESGIRCEEDEVFGLRHAQ